MTSTNIGKRTSEFIALAAFTIGLALGSATVANAEWDIEAYDKCMDDPKTDTFYEFEICCKNSGGVVGRGGGVHCNAPSVNDPMAGQPAPPRSPEEIVSGPVNEFNVPDGIVPGAPVLDPGAATP